MPSHTFMQRESIYGKGKEITFKDTEKKGVIKWD
jgi:hypothetical protein